MIRIREPESLLQVEILAGNAVAIAGKEHSAEILLDTHLVSDFFSMRPGVSKGQLRCLGVLIVEMQIVFFGKTDSSVELMSGPGTSFVSVTEPGFGHRDLFVARETLT